MFWHHSHSNPPIQVRVSYLHPEVPLGTTHIREGCVPGEREAVPEPANQLREFVVQTSAPWKVFRDRMMVDKFLEAFACMWKDGIIHLCRDKHMLPRQMSIVS